MTPEVLTPFALEFWIDTGVALFCGAKDWREDHPTQWITSRCIVIVGAASHPRACFQ